jgi:hypothetical protein
MAVTAHRPPGKDGLSEVRSQILPRDWFFKIISDAECGADQGRLFEPVAGEVADGGR